MRPSVSVTLTRTTNAPRGRPLRLTVTFPALRTVLTLRLPSRTSALFSFAPFGARTVRRSVRRLMHRFADGSETTEEKRTVFAAAFGVAAPPPGFTGSGNCTIHVREAGGPTLPVGSVPLTCSWWPPMSSPFSVNGESHGTNAPPSTLHVSRVPGLLEEKVNVAERDSTTPDGPLWKVMSGGGLLSEAVSGGGVLRRAVGGRLRGDELDAELQRRREGDAPDAVLADRGRRTGWAGRSCPRGSGRGRRTPPGPPGAAR